MAETVIKQNQSIAPFFGDRMKVISGLDALGQQNTSDATYQMLMPGLNNVTIKVRYYSFFCWLLDTYSERIGSTNPEDFRRFIRKAEYLVALASLYEPEDATGVSGRDYASRQLEENPAVFDLSEGIYNDDGSTSDTYWNFSLGIFGQYYIGSMRDMALITSNQENDSVYIRTKSENDEWIDGVRLTKAFAANLSEKSRALFLESMEKEKIPREAVADLLPGFSIYNVPEGTDEQQLILEMLLQTDKPALSESTTYRRDSIKYMLEYAREKGVVANDRSFITHVFEQKGRHAGKEDDVLTGWYFYQFNEYWQYACAAILSGCLDYLSSFAPQPAPYEAFVKDVSGNVAKAMNETIPGTAESPLQDVIHAVGSDEAANYQSLRKAKELELVTGAFVLLFSLYKNNEAELDRLFKFGNKHGLIRSGSGIEYLSKRIQNYKQGPLADFFFTFLHKNILMRHQLVAYRKMGNGSQTTQKFLLEDHHIRFLGDMGPAYTGPRIGNLIRFLKELGILTSDGALTPSGEQLRKRLWNEND